MLIPSFSRSTHSPSERKRMKESERKRKREKNMTNASDFPFHCFPIINFAARVWIPTDCNTRKQRKEWHERKEPNRKKNSTFADLISPSFPRSLCSRFSGYLCGRFQVLFHFSAHTQQRQTYGKLNFIGSSLWENEPNCHNNKGMTSLQTRDRSFTTNQATGMCKHVGTRIKSLFLSKRISSTRNIFTLLNATLLLVSLAPAFPIVDSVHCSCVCVCARIYKSIVRIHFSTMKPENDEKSMRFSD